uniref:Immunoglobulin I-set domain-containing protein n=1 Tax=Amphiprion percula TaxID=161767 RepID=A0A3P8S063_AMPPE
SKPSADKETPGLPETKPVPPEPRKRLHRKASIVSLEKDVESGFDLKSSLQKENNEVQKIIQPDGECSLVIKNLISSDSGVYACEAVNKFGVASYNGNVTVVQPTPQRPVHLPLAAITPLQLAPTKPEARSHNQSQETSMDANYVESVSVSLWEAFNLMEPDSQMNLQEKRCSSLIASSSEEHIQSCKTKLIQLQN